MPTLSQQAQTVLDALQRFGPIRNIGSMIYDGNMAYLCSPTELLSVSRELSDHGTPIHRTDAGGTPTWELRTDD